MKKYKTSRYSNEIKSVEVERATEKSVWINARRSAKCSDWDIYHDTWDLAHKFLLSKAERKLDTARRMLQSAQGNYGNVKGMKKP